MLRSLHFLRYILLSFGLHGLLLAALYYFTGPAGGAPQETTPVRIVDLPPQVAKRLPPVEQRPIPRPAQPFRPRTLTPLENDSPSVRTGKSPDVSVPKVSPEHGRPDGSDKGKADSGRKDIGTTERGRGALPFLSQNDIDDLAAKGFPEWKLKGDSLSRETEGFKYYGYTKWFIQQLNKNARYPELAAISGLQGDVYVLVEILKDGALGKAEVVKSSGYKILDDEVVRTIQLSAPFQPLPDDWNTDRYTVPIIGMFRIYYIDIR